MASSSSDRLFDGHVHTEWSWDAAGGSMDATCRSAVALGMPTIAFTDHADFTDWVTADRARELRGAGGLSLGVRPIGPHRPDGALDIAGYWDSIDRCRSKYRDLTILSGIELGEPHRFEVECEALLAHRPLDRVLGSAHCLPVDGRLIDCSGPGFMDVVTSTEKFRTYLGEVLMLVEHSSLFGVLAHLDYPKRYWPHAVLPFHEEDFEDEYRAVLRALASSGRVLEVNTSRGADVQRGLCPGPTVLRWWREEGGRALSFGSDAHDPQALLRGFPAAVAAAEAAGFTRGKHPADVWRP